MGTRQSLLSLLVLLACVGKLLSAQATQPTNYVVGPQDANDWFILLPERVVDAVAALEPTKLQRTAALWSASASDLDPNEAERLLARLVPFGKLAKQQNRRVYFWGSR